MVEGLHDIPVVDNRKFTQTSQLVGYIPALTGIRAIAAYMVYLHHSNPFNSFNAEKSGFGYYAFLICREFHVGVTIFFTLSGFLIAHRYLNRVEFSRSWVFTYFRNRIVRIYPLYFLLTVLVFAIWFYDNHSIYIGPFNNFKTQNEALLIFGLNLTFLRGFSDTIKFSGIAPGWSLTVEETFYFLAPFILWWIVADKKRLWVLPPLFAVIGLILVKAFEIWPVLGVMDTYEFMWSFTFFGRCFEFAAGIFLAMILRSAPVITTRNRMVLTGAGCVLIILCLNILAFFQETYIRILVNNILLTLAIVLFFYGLLTERNLIHRLLASRILQMLGKSSYAFYLIHVGIISVWLDQVKAPSYVIFIVLNCVAILLYKYIEEPSNQFLRKRLNYRQ